MAEVTINMPDGTQSTGVIPDFALDSTMEKMLAIMEKNFPKDVFKDIKKSQEESLKVAKDVAKETKKSQEEADKDREAQLKALKELADSGAEFSVDQDAVDRYNKAMARGEKIFTTAYSAITGFAGALIAAGSLVVGTFIKEFLSIGNELNSLTDAGVGYIDSLEQGGMRATTAMAQLSLEGIDAATTLASFSNVVATQGKSAFVDLVAGFTQATQSGSDLAMSLDASIERFGNELSVRQQLGALDTASAAGRANLNKQVQTNIKRQQQYSRALGVSTDTLAEFSKTILLNTPVLAATMIRFSNDVRGKVTAGITDFATALRGMGGEEGGQIAAAFTEAASMGAMGFSEEMTGYVRAVPSLAGPMNQYIRAIQSGTLSQEEAAEMGNQITMSLGNLSQAEKNRVFALARAGDQQAISMAKAITQFEQSSKKLKEINSDLNMEDVQKGSNVMNSVLKKLTGVFEALQYSFFSGVGATSKVSEAFSNAYDVINEALRSVFGFGETTGDINKTFGSLGEQLAEKLPDVIAKVAEKMAQLIKWFGEFFKKGDDGKSKFDNLITGIGEAITGFMNFASMMGTVLKVLVPVLAGLMLFKGIGAVVGGVTSMFKGITEAGGSVKGAIGKMFGGKDSVASKAGSAGSSVADKMQVADKSAGGAGKGMASFGKGFGKMLKGMAKGLMALANPAVLIGLAAVVLGINGIALALRIAAPAFESIGKMIASVLGGLKPVLEGFAAIVESLGKAIAHALGGVGDIIKAWGNAFMSVLTGVGKIVESIGKGIAFVFMGIGGAIEKVGSGIYKVITGLGEGFRLLGQGIENVGSGVQNVGEGIAAVFNSIASVITAVGNSIKGVFTGIGDMMETTFDALGRLNPVQLLGAAAGITAVGASLAALGAGKMIEGITGFIGALFGGGKDPIEQLIKLGNVAPNINELGDTMSNFGEIVDKFNEGIGKLDGTHAKDQLALMSEGFVGLSEALDNISIVDLMKLAALKITTPADPQEEEPLQKKEGAQSPNQIDPAEKERLTALARAGDTDAQNQLKALEDFEPVTEMTVTEPDTPRKVEIINMPQSMATAVGNMGTAAKTNPLEGIDNFSVQGFSERKFAENDNENYSKFFEERKEKRGEFRKQYREGKISENTMRAEQMFVDRDMIKKYAPQISAAGAGSFINNDTGKEVQFAKPQTETMQPPTAPQTEVKAPQGPVVPEETEVSNKDGKTTETPANPQTELLAELLSETRKQNKLLRQQISGTHAIADQI